MSPKDIHIGRTYVNRGKGRTFRTVLDITDDPGMGVVPWFSDSPRPQEKAVLYRQAGVGTARLFISSFAKWAGREVECG